jgi:hypothetical protein
VRAALADGRVARTKARWWNPDDPRLFTPKVSGWGFAVNFARVPAALKRSAPTLRPQYGYQTRGSTRAVEFA